MFHRSTHAYPYLSFLLAATLASLWLQCTSGAAEAGSSLFKWKLFSKYTGGYLVMHPSGEVDAGGDDKGKRVCDTSMHHN